MRTLIITVAGSATRFGRSVGRPCVKCLYYETDPSEALLYRLLHKDDSFDRYIIVGGYRISELYSFVDSYLENYKSKTVVLNNEHYSDFGSGYSLYMGLKKAVELESDEIVFAEGDLYIDDDGFGRVVRAKTDVITYNRNPIEAKTAVAFYFDSKNAVHFIYDTGHDMLSIDEPFCAIYNSGQIWKFYDAARVRKCIDEIDELRWRGTNLVFIQEYFGKLSRAEYLMVDFKEWVNCNTVDDFRKIKER